jgi:ferredoxin-thioredoxin reductase catalytic subunit
MVSCLLFIKEPRDTQREQRWSLAAKNMRANMIVVKDINQCLAGAKTMYGNRKSPARMLAGKAAANRTV